MDPSGTGMDAIRGVTLDFYLTLVHHRGAGRGASLMDYLAERGLSSAPWEHQVLYDVFEFYGEAYRPGGSAAEHRRFWCEFTGRLFRRLDVSGAGSDRPRDHAEAVRRLLGPSSLRVFDDAPALLDWLGRSGTPVGIVSNWQCGLEHFCRELGLLRHVDFVIASAEVGAAKPDRRIFRLAVERLGLPARAVIHVGDHPLEDAQGATEAGLRAALLARTEPPPPSPIPLLRTLAHLPPFLSRKGDIPTFP